MSAAVSEDKIKRVTRFDPPGINFKAKLIGLEDVTDPRGDKMCQVAMAKLKAAVVAMGDHKQRITVNVSLEGIKLIDEKSENVLHSHPVHRISFISRDTNDSRAFGYVYNREDGVHQFCGIKTEKAAEPLVTCLKDLFQTVVELKKEKEKENAKNENNALTIVATEIKDVKEKEVEEVQVEKSPAASTDLLGLESSVAGVQQSMNQMNVFSASSTSDSSSAWLNNNLFQNVPTQNVTNLQTTGVLHLPQAAAISGNPYLPQGMTAAAPRYQIPPSYPQQPFTSYNPSFPSQTPAGGVAVVGGAAGLHTAWPNTGPPAAGNLQGNPSWMSFDSSTQLSSIFGDLSSPASTPQTGSGVNNAFSAVPMQPTSIHPPTSDPFAPAAKFPDPFADLAVLQSQTASQPFKKASKEDFLKEPPKPTLLDLSTQQQRQQPANDLTTAAGDPFATVSPPRSGSPFGANPFQQENQNFHTSPFAPNPAQQRTVDKSRAIYPPAPSLFGEAQNSQLSGGIPPYASPARPDVVDLASSQVSRPRPKSNAGTKAALVLPLTPKVKPSMLCTNPLKHLHDGKLLRNNNNNDTIECKIAPDDLPASDVIQHNNPGQPLAYLQRSISAENAPKSFDELWLSSAAHRERVTSSDESIWCLASINDESGKNLDLEKREIDRNLKCNALCSSDGKQNSTPTANNQNLDMDEICVKSFENCPTTTENVTNHSELNVSLTKKDTYLKVSDRDLSITVPGRTKVNLSKISEPGNITQANTLQSNASTSNASGKMTLASLARRSSARKTCSLQGLVTIREENDPYKLHPSLQPAMSGDEGDNRNLLRAPSFLTKHMLIHETGAENCTHNAAKDASNETRLKLNPFADVDPFVTDKFSLGDPFENQNGCLVCKDACGFFDLLQVDSTSFCTRAVTVDSNTKKVC